MLSFFKTPPGYKPADSITIALATALGVAMIYNAKIGPVCDVSMTDPGTPAINSSIKKAGWEGILLVAGLTLLSRDLNVTILGGAAVIFEHITYLHGEMSNPGTGRIDVNPEAYQPAGMAAGANQPMTA
jgi:hypothetical protein